MVLRILLAICLGLVVLSCDNKDEGFVQYQLRDVTMQYTLDSETIEKYLEENTISVDSADGIKKYSIREKKEGETSITGFSGYKMVEYAVGDLTYNIHYVELSKGKNIQPIRFDSLFVSYKGMNLKNETFLDNQEPRWEVPSKTRKSGELFSLTAPQLISTLFKSGDFTPNGDGTFTFTDYGHGIVFVPSGLGFFDMAQPSLDSYSPIVLEFKLYHVRQRDHDGDGVKTFEEKTNLTDNPFDGFYELDTDGDGIANFMDADDDGDGILTKTELSYKDKETSEGVKWTDGNADGDDYLDYLDNNDDGDEILTKDEDTNGNGDWTDDDANGNGIPNYLDKEDK